MNEGIHLDLASQARSIYRIYNELMTYYYYRKQLFNISNRLEQQ